MFKLICFYNITSVEHIHNVPIRFIDAICVTTSNYLRAMIIVIFTTVITVWQQTNYLLVDDQVVPKLQFDIFSLFYI